MLSAAASEVFVCGGWMQRMHARNMRRAAVLLLRARLPAPTCDAVISENEALKLGKLWESLERGQSKAAER